MQTHINTTLKAVILTILSGMAWIMSSCQDDFDYRNDIIGDGEALVSLNVSFNPPTGVKLSSRTDGNALDSFSDVWVVIFKEGKIYEKHYFKKDDFIKYQHVANPDTNNVLYQDMAHAELPALTLPYGSYKIYAVGNMGVGFDDKLYVNGEAIKEEDFRNLKLDWAWPASVNNQMAGHFEVVKDKNTQSKKVASDSYNSATTCVIASPHVYLHAWMRRAAAKVTVAFDASEMRENITVYLKSVKIHDGAKTCNLLDKNVMGSKDDLIMFDVKDTDSILYSTSDDYSKWPSVTKGAPKYGEHTSTGKALFCYENMQGDSKDPKPQQPDGDNSSTLTQEIKDEMPYGTYIEVEAYYVSRATGNEGRGPIKYRFMLGKDVEYNCDVERNYHYMLTLNFKGNANDVDWHIEYKEVDTPGISLPVNFYASYLYGQVTEYPIKIELGEGQEFTRNYIDATITFNDWGPCTDNDVEDSDTALRPDDDELNTGEILVYDGKNGMFRDGVWNGFLSIYEDKRTGFNTDNQTYYSYTRNYNELDWYGLNDGNDSANGDGSGKSPNIDIEEYDGVTYTVKAYKSDASNNATPLTTYKDVKKNQGYRRYNVPESDGTFYYNSYVENGTPNGNVGEYTYRVVRSGKKVTFYIPMYIRPIILTTATSYTGNNPYVAFRRKARVKISAEINNKVIDNTGTLYQARRLINPKFVYRKHDNVRPFTVTLLHRKDESKTSEFIPYTSKGPWKAEIITGSGWTIVGRSSGSSGSNIVVNVAPIRAIESNQTQCAILKISYHNYTCHHQVLLHQGSAPTQLVDNGVYWRNSNLWHGTTEGSTPLDEGSLFFHATYNDPIDPINNTLNDFNLSCPYGSNDWKNLTYGGYYIKAPFTPGDNPTLGYWGSTYPVEDDATSAFDDLTINDVDCRVASYEDFIALRDSSYIEISYGVGYADGAGATQNALNRVFRNAWYKRTKPDKSKLLDQNYYGRGLWDDDAQEGEWYSDLKDINGMRGCVVYNKLNGNSVFFPMGQSGYGRRQGSGELRYTGASGPLGSYQGCRPILVYFYLNIGAIYWVKQGAGTLEKPTAWDFNYSTFDFNNFGNNATSNSACFIRLVQTTPP